MVVSVRNLTRRFGEFTAVDSISFDIHQGECFGLLGPNGAGKSTVLRMLYGASLRTSGEISILGFDPKKHSREIKKRTGVVTQDNSLDEGMDVLGNMMMFARFLGFDKKRRQARVAELLEFMALSHKAHAPIRTLSGGMQRRLVFVRALLSDPDFVILDEPTTGLDPAVRKVIWDRVNDLLGRQKTVLLTTHYMDEAEILCNRIVIMNEGKLQAIGTPRELIDRHTPGYVAVISKLEPGKINTFKINPAVLEVREDVNSVTLRVRSLGEITSLLENAKIIPDIIRPANLEDAFLKITGRELNSDA